MHDGSEQFNVPQVHAMTALRHMPGCSLSCNAKRVELILPPSCFDLLACFFSKNVIAGRLFLSTHRLLQVRKIRIRSAPSTNQIT